MAERGKSDRPHVDAGITIIRKQDMGLPHAVAVL